MRDNTDNMYNHIDINGTDYIDITNVQGQSPFNEPSIHESDPYSGELPGGSYDSSFSEQPEVISG